jgi:hypothetical protein
MQQADLISFLDAIRPNRKRKKIVGGQTRRLHYDLISPVTKIKLGHTETWKDEDGYTASKVIS